MGYARAGAMRGMGLYANLYSSSGVLSGQECPELDDVTLLRYSALRQVKLGEIR